MPFNSWVSSVEICGLHDPFRIFILHSQHLEGEHLDRDYKNMENTTAREFLPCTPKMWENFFTSSQQKESLIASDGTAYPFMRAAFILWPRYLIKPSSVSSHAPPFSPEEGV